MEFYTDISILMLKCFSLFKNDTDFIDAKFTVFAYTVLLFAKITVWKNSMSSLPIFYKPLTPFLKLAAKLRSYDVVSEYWCLRYVRKRVYAMKLYSKECIKFAFSLNAYMNMIRGQFFLLAPFEDKCAARPFLLCEATRLFERADTFDRHARYSLSLVQLYNDAANLLTVLSMLCKLDDIVSCQTIKIQKYCRWRALYLFSCFKNGETPLPPPKSTMLGLDSFQSDEERLRCPWKHEEIIPLGEKIVMPVQFWNFPNDCSQPYSPFEDLVERFGHFNVAYKLCQSAMNALENDNVEDEDRFMEDATVCFGSKDAVLSLSHSDLDEDRQEVVKVFTSVMNGLRKKANSFICVERGESFEIAWANLLYLHFSNWELGRLHAVQVTLRVIHSWYYYYDYYIIVCRIGLRAVSIGCACAATNFAIAHSS
ncbi:hypothetical protein Tsp_11183 [Trichinella spiralis]|uniref:hypothetical protein n=1 Tax=Trichinella spiralis TaxID=6334 RepID=UPI0001EFECBA|nr:hypothetical protein Tsp_11183 [Trichinella spiralis]